MVMGVAQPGPMAMQRSGLQIISEAELAKHNTEDDLWVVVHGLVYDLTTFEKV